MKLVHMKLHFICTVFCVFLCRVINCLHLKDIDVPSMILINDEETETVVLDCDYELDEQSQSLVVKWLKDDIPVYQWIRGREPTVYPIFQDFVQNPYSMSEDEDFQYKGLALTNPTINTAGTYRCVVQTDSETRFMEKRLQVIDIKQHTINLYHQKYLNRTHLECTVDKVFPEPAIQLSTDDNDEVSVVSFQSNEVEDGYFNATSIAIVNDDYDDADPDSYKCTVTFMDLPFNLTTDATSGSSMKNLCRNLLLGLLLIKIVI